MKIRKVSKTISNKIKKFAFSKKETREKEKLIVIDMEEKQNFPPSFLI